MGGASGTGLMGREELGVGSWELGEPGTCDVSGLLFFRGMWY